MIKVKINKDTIKLNPYYMQTFFRVYLGKEETKNKKGEIVEVKYNYDTFYTFPDARKYLYKYIFKYVRCYYCEKRFCVQRLQSDSLDGGYIYSSEVCPYCGTWECLDDRVHYETIEELEIRIGKKIEKVLK